MIDELKIWCAVRTDMMDGDQPWYLAHPGKLATQAGHGYASALYRAMGKDPARVAAYMQDAQPKITLRADNAAMLDRIERECRDAGVNVYAITDAGRTVFDEPTKTVCAFGPAYKSELPPYLKRLRLL